MYVYAKGVDAMRESMRVAMRSLYRCVSLMTMLQVKMMLSVVVVPRIALCSR